MLGTQMLRVPKIPIRPPNHSLVEATGAGVNTRNYTINKHTRLCCRMFDVLSGLQSMATALGRGKGAQAAGGRWEDGGEKSGEALAAQWLDEARLAPEAAYGNGGQCSTLAIVLTGLAWSHAKGTWGTSAGRTWESLARLERKGRGIAHRLSIAL